MWCSVYLEQGQNNTDERSEATDVIAKNTKSGVAVISPRISQNT